MHEYFTLSLQVGVIWIMAVQALTDARDAVWGEICERQAR